MDTLINDFTKALIPIVITLVTGLVALLLNQVREYVARRVGEEQTRLIEDVLAQAVKAAKQTMALAPGKEKKKAALTHAQLALTQLGLKVDIELLASWIEAALYDINAEEAQDAAYTLIRTSPVASISVSTGNTATGTGMES